MRPDFFLDGSHVSGIYRVKGLDPVDDYVQWEVFFQNKQEAALFYAACVVEGGHGDVVIEEVHSHTRPRFNRAKISEVLLNKEEILR